jgi:hypothetical protein
MAPRHVVEDFFFLFLHEDSEIGSIPPCVCNAKRMGLGLLEQLHRQPPNGRLQGVDIFVWGTSVLHPLFGGAIPTPVPPKWRF